MYIVIGGIITISYWGICGSFTLIFAHGLCYFGLFCLADVSYEHLSSRKLLISQGILNLIPRISFWWFMLSACNIAAPPPLNLLGKIRF
jgi:NADH-ubiquinone oxidoreductase chain 4